MYLRFNRALLAACLAGLSGMLALALWLEPVLGDLTRLGFRTENAHGWHGAQAAFSPPLAQPGRLDGRYDVVVLGDSFSGAAPGLPQGGHWTDHFAAATGLSVGVFEARQIQAETLLSSPAAQGARLFVLQLAERMLAATLDRPGPCAVPPPPLPVALPAPATPLAPTLHRRFSGPDLSPGRAEYLFAFLRATAQRALTGNDGSKVRLLRLDPPAPFTSRRPDLLLVYNQDYDRRAWDAASWHRIACRAAAIQAASVRAGLGFLLLVAPDKTTAYASHLAAADRSIDAVPRLAATPGLALVRADLALRAAIAAGITDVYLPDDTHWGSAGASIVARLVRDAAARPAE